MIQFFLFVSGCILLNSLAYADDGFKLRPAKIKSPIKATLTPIAASTPVIKVDRSKKYVQEELTPRIVLVNNKNGKTEHIDYIAKNEIAAHRLMAQNPSLQDKIEAVKKETIENNEFKASLSNLKEELTAKGKTVSNPVIYINVDDSNTKENLPLDFKKWSKADQTAYLLKHGTEMHIDIEGKDEKKIVAMASVSDGKNLANMPDIIRKHTGTHKVLSAKEPSADEKKKILAEIGTIVTTVATLHPIGRAAAIVGMASVLVGCGGDGGDDPSLPQQSSNDGNNPPPLIPPPSPTPPPENCNCNVQLQWDPYADNAVYFQAYYRPRGGTEDQWRYAGQAFGRDATSMTISNLPQGDWDIAITAYVAESFYTDPSGRRILGESAKTPPLPITIPRPAAQ